MILPRAISTAFVKAIIHVCGKSVKAADGYISLKEKFLRIKKTVSADRSSVSGRVLQDIRAPALIYVGD